MFNHAFFVWEVGLEHNNKQIVSDMSEGVIRNPLAFNFPIQRGFSGSIQTLPKRQASHAWVSQEMKQSSAGKQHCVRPLHSATIYTMAVQLCG